MEPMNIQKYLHFKNVFHLVDILWFLKNCKTIVESLKRKETLTLKDINNVQHYFNVLF